MVITGSSARLRVGVAPCPVTVEFPPVRSLRFHWTLFVKPSIKTLQN